MRRRSSQLIEAGRHELADLLVLNLTARQAARAFGREHTELIDFANAGVWPPWLAVVDEAEGWLFASLAPDPHRSPTETKEMAEAFRALVARTIRENHVWLPNTPVAVSEATSTWVRAHNRRHDKRLDARLLVDWCIAVGDPLSATAGQFAWWCQRPLPTAFEVADRWWTLAQWYQQFEGWGIAAENPTVNTKVTVTYDAA